MALGGVHGLGETDVGADGGAEEVEDPEGWVVVVSDGEPRGPIKDGRQLYTSEHTWDDTQV